MTDSTLPRELVDLAARVISANLAAGRTVAVAESCTGGLVGSALTEIAGSSRVFDRGFITYSNEAKTEMLGVAPDLIDTFGAVSIAVAWAMADGALNRSNADVAVAITGVAGPDGGTPNKPVGTVVFAVSKRDHPDESAANAEMKQLDPAEGRAGIRRQAALVALELLLP
jgi:nicotinamide-nucleotide amidase